MVADIRHITDVLREHAIDAISNIVTHTNPVRNRSIVQGAVLHALQPILERGDIAGYKVNVTSDDSYRFGERDVAPDALPGDMHGKTGGIIVSTDGKGRGIILDPNANPPAPGIMKVSIEVKVFKPVMWMTIEFSVGND